MNQSVDLAALSEGELTESLAVPGTCPVLLFEPDRSHSLVRHMKVRHEGALFSKKRLAHCVVTTGPTILMCHSNV